MEHEYTRLLREVAGPLPTLDEAGRRRVSRASGWKLPVLMSALAGTVGLLLLVTLIDRTETVKLAEPPALGGSAVAVPLGWGVRSSPPP